MHATRLLWAVYLAPLLGSLACSKAPKQGPLAERDAASAKEHAGSLFKEAESGLATASTALATTPIEALARDPLLAKDALRNARRGAEALRVAPLSFFALTDGSGRIIRSSLDVDLLATERLDANCVKGSPSGGALRIATSLPGSLGPSLIFCSPLSPKKDGAVVAGWNFVDLAIVLRNFIRDRVDAERDAGRFDAKTPLLYAAVFDEKSIGWTPETPAIVRTACENLGFRAGPKRPPYELEIESRPYGLATSPLTDDAHWISVVIVHSDI